MVRKKSGSAGNDSAKGSSGSQRDRGSADGPLGMVTLTRERIQEVIDDAVMRGRMTHSDATELMQSLMSKGRRQTGDLIRRAREAAGIGAEFPIDNYGDLKAREVIECLDGLNGTQLRRVRDFERRNANRKSVLQAIDRLLSS